MLQNRPPISFAVLALAALLMAACSRQKSISRDQAQSDIRSSLSFAAESEIFIDFVLKGHALASIAPKPFAGWPAAERVA
jgi:hypothetical protein